MAEQITPQPDDDVLDEFLAPLTQRIRGRDGTIKTYVVSESSGGPDFWAWMSKLTALQSSVAGADAHATAVAGETFDQLQAELISLCVSVDGKPVTKDMALSWGQALRRAMFARCQTMNGMEVGVVDREGKGSGGVESFGTGSASPAASTGPSPAVVGN